MKFNLSEALADLLAQIHARHTFQTELSVAWQRFWDNNEEYEAAIAYRNSRCIGRTWAVDELEALNGRIEQLQDQKSAAWDEYQSVRRPIRKFVADLSLVLERLPLDPEWAEFKKALIHLRFDRSEAWIEPPGIVDLETAAFRLDEMLRLARRPLRVGELGQPSTDAKRLSPKDRTLYEHIMRCGGDFRAMTNPKLQSKGGQMKHLEFSGRDAIRQALNRIRRAMNFPSSGSITKRSNAVS